MNYNEIYEEELGDYDYWSYVDYEIPYESDADAGAY